MTIVTTTASPRPEARTLAQQAYQCLRDDILSCALKPGAWLRIDALRTRYDIGPTPIREALSRLASEGFVVGVENRGFRIPPVSLDDLRDVTTQRKLIECAALRAAIERADEGFESAVAAAHYRLARVEERLAGKDPAVLVEWERRHRAFHRALILGAGSPWLERFQDVLYDQADRYRRLYLPEVDEPLQVVDHHRRMAERVLARDADGACVVLGEHIDRVYRMAVASRRFAGAS